MICLSCYKPNAVTPCPSCDCLLALCDICAADLGENHCGYCEAATALTLNQQIAQNFRRYAKVLESCAGEIAHQPDDSQHERIANRVLEVTNALFEIAMNTLPAPTEQEIAKGKEYRREREASRHLA